MYKHLIVFSVFSSVLIAGPKVIGNGGDAVVCRSSSGEISSVELLDYYEGKTFFDFKIEAPPAGTDVQVLVKTFIDRVAKRDPVLSDLLLDGLIKFNNNVKYIPSIVLEDITDSKHLYFPKNCGVEQLANQRESQLQEPVKFVISKDLWDKMDVLNQAGLILHEVLYRQYIVNQISAENVDSRLVRKFNAMIASDLLATVKEKEFNKLVSVFRPQASQRGILGVTLFRSYESGGIPTTSEQVYTVDGEVVHKVTCHFNQVGKGIDLEATVKVKGEVGDNFVVHFDSKVERSFSADKKNFCVASLSRTKTSVNFISSSEVLIGDLVWNIKTEVKVPPKAIPAISNNSEFVMKKWHNKMVLPSGPIEIVQDLTTPGILKVTVTCQFSDGITIAKVDAPVTLSNSEIRNPEARYKKEYSKSGRFYCMAVIADRTLRYKVLNDSQISITGDEFIPDGTILNEVK